MKPIHAITIEKNCNDFDRIGHNKRNPRGESAIKIEKLILNTAPLPASFDVTPVQHHYFSEFVYFDTMGGLILETMSGEVSAMLMEDALIDMEPDFELLNTMAVQIHDKYLLGQEPQSPDDAEIVFLPGSNLLHVVNREVLDRAMLTNSKLVIKPHPITRPETLRFLGMNYGYHRVIDPALSGVGLLKRAARVYTASNSEIGLMAAALRIPCVDISSMKYQPIMSYSPIYRLFKDNDTEGNARVLATLLANKQSGFLMPWFEDNEVRAKNYFEHAMRVRECYKPMYAASIYMFDTPIQKGAPNAVCKG